MPLACIQCKGREKTVLQPYFTGRPTGWWIKGNAAPETGAQALRAALMRVGRPAFLMSVDGVPAVAHSGKIIINDYLPVHPEGFPLHAYAPPLRPESLGSPLFKETHRIRYPYVAGAMANGITSVEMVEAVGRAGMLGFFGAAGLSPEEVESAVDRLQTGMGDLPFGFNLIHSPNEPELEWAVTRLYLKRGVRLVSASAYMDMTPALVYYRFKGVRADGKGGIICPNKVMAKVSRVEVARKFFSPPPDRLLNHLVEKDLLTREEAELARRLPVAEDLTAEADSGGHTDNRPAISLLPVMTALRDEMTDRYKYARPLCVGLGGGVATPSSAAAAFAMGAAYVLTGSVNQSCAEAGTSDAVKKMLAEAGQADITMAPAADMFEMGVKVQVLKRGTMFPQRAARLYDLYNRHDALENLPAKERMILERDYFKCGLDAEWEQTKAFFRRRDPKQIDRAERDAKHKMALVFRSYLGRSSVWAVTGDPSRVIDYQIWCGPALGAFNEWVRGSFLEKPENRKTVTVAMNLLLGAAVQTRFHWLRSQGAALPERIGAFTPMRMADMAPLLKGQDE